MNGIGADLVVGGQAGVTAGAQRLPGKAVALSAGLFEQDNPGNFGAPPKRAVTRTCGWTTPTPSRRAGVHRRHQGRREMARLRPGYEHVPLLDYFDQIYDMAVVLIKAGKAYVCDLTGDEISKTRHAGSRQESPWRIAASKKTSTSSTACARASSPTAARPAAPKIDMASPNFNLRESRALPHPARPAPARRQQVVHHPMYDWALRPVRLDRRRHAPSARWSSKAASRCTTGSSRKQKAAGFTPNWQRPAAASPSRIGRRSTSWRLNLTYTMLSKRKLLELVKTGVVSGWMTRCIPTIIGYRRKGYTPRPSATSRTKSASPSLMASSTSPAWRTPCGPT